METTSSEEQKKEQKGEVTGEEFRRLAPALTPGFEKIKRRYEEIYGKQMTDEQISNLFKTAQILEISENDGIWNVLLAQENFFRLLMELPWTIVAACKAMIKEMMDVHEAQHRKAVEDTRLETARIARQNARLSKPWYEWIIQGALTAGVTCSVGLSFTVFKLLAFKTVPNAEFSDLASSLFRFFY